jgi:hypothetical protein
LGQNNTAPWVGASDLHDDSGGTLLRRLVRSTGGR